uniref:Uncharacterized protein n=1 Tax=Anguilla anguilla TaxID=7936 RepID=A0A0E9U8Z9_ANGAN
MLNQMYRFDVFHLHFNYYAVVVWKMESQMDIKIVR